MFAGDAMVQAVGPGDQWGLLSDPLAMALVPGVSAVGTKCPFFDCSAVFCSGGVVLSAGGWLCLMCLCALEWEWGAGGLCLMASLGQEGCAIP